MAVNECNGDVSPTIHNVGVTCRLEPLRSAHLCLWTQTAAPRSTAGSVNSKRSPCFVPCKTRSSPKNGRYKIVAKIGPNSHANLRRRCGHSDSVWDKSAKVG